MYVKYHISNIFFLKNKQLNTCVQILKKKNKRVIKTYIFSLVQTLAKFIPIWISDKQ